MKRILILFALCLVAGCNLPRQGGGKITREDRILTAAAQTVAAVYTSTAAGTSRPLATTPPPAAATDSPAPINTPTTTNSPGPTDTPTLSGPCNLASFESDETIPDGFVVPPGLHFTKTWLIKNTGACSWNTGYSVVFANRGRSMTEQASFPLLNGGEIKPGETARVSVELVAPAETGSYQGYWRLRSDKQEEFGTGPQGTGDFFVQIEVAEEYSLARLSCMAEWSTAEKELPCPGKDGDTSGYVVPVENPDLEDHIEREGQGISLKPQPVAGGYVLGKFPALIVPEKSDFRATLSCQPGATGCYVRFRVAYRIDNGEEIVLGEWNEGYEGGITNAVKDLDMLAGKSVTFYLYVYSAGTPDESKAIWFDPRISK